MDENHRRFLNHLDNSSEAVFVVAKYLYLKGLDVRINALSKAEKHSDWKKHKDDGDLFVYKNNQTYRVEVKGLSCTFTNQEDWPFKDFIVCAKHSFDNATPKPHVYFILSKQKTHAAIVKSKDSEYWSVVSRKDNRYNEVNQEFYISKFDYIKWVEI